MIRGSCLCGAVLYGLDGELQEMGNCHCSMCRKAHGAAFATYGRARAAEFRFTKGEEMVRRYRSSPRVERLFCSVCGSNLLFVYEGMPDNLWIATGTLDDDPVLRPHSHIFVGSKAPWHEITDDLPQHDELPPME